MKYLPFILFIIGITSCTEKSSYSYHQVFENMNAKTALIELSNNHGKSRLMISPELQGRIITSTSNGTNGECHAWFNKEILEPDKGLMSGIGGEDRVWIGPLGGQYSFYYQQIQPLSEDNWHVPETIDAAPYQLISKSEKGVRMKKEMQLFNFLGTEFNIRVNRDIQILDKTDIENNLALKFDSTLEFVAFESKNAIINLGTDSLKKETGLLAVWSAGMFEGSEESVVIIPLRNTKDESAIYKYMGPLNDKRLKFKGEALLFKADGKYRSKIGVPPEIAPSIYGCYSRDKKRLTIVEYRKTQDSLYFNSNVSVQENPYKGEVIPIYNNGPMDYKKTEEVSFFELESTSSMQELAPHDSIFHYHRVYHFTGGEGVLNQIAEQLLHIHLEDCNLNE